MFLLHNNSQCPKNRQIVGADLMYSQVLWQNEMICMAALNKCWITRELPLVHERHKLVALSWGFQGNLIDVRLCILKEGPCYQAVALLGYYLETENWKLCSENERDSEQCHWVDYICKLRVNCNLLSCHLQFAILGFKICLFELFDKVFSVHFRGLSINNVALHMSIWSTICISRIHGKLGHHACCVTFTKLDQSCPWLYVAYSISGLNFLRLFW